MARTKSKNDTTIKTKYVNPYDVYLNSIKKYCRNVNTIEEDGEIRIPEEIYLKMSEEDIKSLEEYISHNNESDKNRYAHELAAGKKVTQKQFSDEWGISVDEEEEKYLNIYYSRLMKEKDLSTVTAQDMARKLAKYSLFSNQAMEKYRNEEVSLKELNEIQSAYEALSKTSNLAPSKNKNGEGFYIGDIVKYIEENNQALLEKKVFEPDTVDQIITEYRNILEATAQNI